MNAATEALAIRARGLEKRFGDKPALRGIDLDVKRGEVFGLLGHNGAGKTTTIRVLNGVLEANGGDMEVLGLSPRSEGARLRRRTGVLTETPATDERLTGRENLAAYAEMYGRQRDDPRIARLLADFELTDAADLRVAKYSKGMRQRLALARTLLHEPELLFLDEPTSGLDPVAAHHVRTLIATLARREGRSVLLCTHNLAEAASLCDRVAVLRDGRVLATGAPRELARGHGPFRLEVEVTPGDEELATRALAPLAVERGASGLLVTGLDAERVPEVVATLVRAGARVRRVAPQEGTLEEFYLALEREASA